MWEEWSNKGDQLNGNTGKKREEKEDRGMRSSKQQSYFGSPRSHQGWWWWFSTKSCPTFAAPWTVYSLPGSSVHGILQARIQEWAAISFSPRVVPQAYYPAVEALCHSECCMSWWRNGTTVTTPPLSFTPCPGWAMTPTWRGGLNLDWWQEMRQLRFFCTHIRFH